MTVYTIKDVSKMFQLPASTLRYYEDMAILTNVRRTAAGQRIYEEKHIHRLRTICCLKRTGLSISKLQMFFTYEEQETEHIDDILDLLIEQQQHIEKQLIQFQKDLEHVKRKLHYYSDIKTALTAKKMHPIWSDYREKQF
ncbi:MerR family transcriptional regulator [Sporolactobacillus shoreicorticis]|uniref:MerR family transcriptional regulator n=1 Tax=Sporolactobacillus shoreicorticis TaxID=1923877 RepID=A0ABW5RZY0_9BACL|nr:MerR family transcriptional regulator [Sporolactobacillus shoreicorticis]MCO7127492.1 MerR family transcriptional regulator [Sporolactobacillus shoreicorticis]